jgi:hypothetical protein
MRIRHLPLYQAAPVSHPAAVTKSRLSRAVARGTLTQLSQSAVSGETQSLWFVADRPLPASVAAGTVASEPSSISAPVHG